MRLSVNALPTRALEAPNPNVRPMRLGVIGAGIEDPDMRALSKAGHMVCKGIPDPNAVSTNAVNNQAGSFRIYRRIDPDVKQALLVAQIIDRIYSR